jgi:hypothetical protein
MNEQLPKDELLFDIHNGKLEASFGFDSDGDLLVQFTDRERTAFYLFNRERARQVRDWLNKVIPS